MSTKTSPGILAPGKQCKHLESKWWDKLGWTDTYKGIFEVFFFWTWLRNCTFILNGVRVSNPPKQTQETAGGCSSQNYHTRQKFRKLLLLYLQCPSGELLTGVTQLNRHYIKTFIIGRGNIFFPFSKGQIGEEQWFSFAFQTNYWIIQVLLYRFCWLNPAQAHVGEAAYRIDILVTEKNFRNWFWFVLISDGKTLRRYLEILIGWNGKEEGSM